MEKKVYVELPPFMDAMSPSPRLQSPCTKMPSMCALACSRES